MWKAAFGGRSERGSTVGVDDTASTASGRRRRHRRSSDDGKSMVSSTSRRTDGDKDRDRDKDKDKKRHSRHESGVSYGSAPIPRLTESAVNAFNANDDDDDIWEDEADLKSERRSEHKRSDSRERRRRKSSGRSERSERSRSRERDGKHKKSSGRSERSRSRERDAWTRKSSGRSERSRSRDREDKDRKRKDDKSSRVDRPNGQSRVSEIVDNTDAVSVMPSTFSIDRFPSVNPSAMNPSTVRFDEHTMSGALDSHVPNQFPGQNPSTYTKSDFEPNPHGAAADYYQDKGQSVNYQPGERAYTPNPSGLGSVAAPSGSTKPTKPAKSTKQSSSSSSSAKPSRKSSRAVSPPAGSSQAIVPVAAATAAITGASSSSRKSSRAVSPPSANHHMQARASTQYEPSALSQNDYRPAPSDFSAMPPSEFSAMPHSEFSAMPPSEFSAMPPSIISGQPPRPVRYNSEPPPTVGAASSYYEGSEMAPSRPAQSGMYPSSSQTNNNNTGKIAAVGAAAAGMAAYGISQHHQQNQQSEYRQDTQHTQHTQHYDQQTQYIDNASRYGAQSQYGSQAPVTPNRPGSYYDSQSASGVLPAGMHHRHEHRGPISRLKDGFLNLLSSPEDVAKMEEYTEYIGVCKNCFDPRSSPYAGPRKHHYHPKKKDSFETLRRRSLERMQRRKSDESLRRTNSKVQKENRYFSTSHMDRKGTSTAGYMAGGLAAAGAATAGAAMFNDRKNFDDTYSVKSGHRASSAIRRRGSNSSVESRRRTSRGRVGGSQHGHHEEFITVRTKDGRVENRKVQHRSRSGSTGRKSNWIGSAAGGAALGAAGAAAIDRHRRRSSPDQVSLRHNEERRYHSRSSSRSHRTGGRSSQHGRSRSSSRSHSPGLGEIFGFSNPKPRRTGRRSPFGSYQDSRMERRHRSRSTSRRNEKQRSEKGGFFTFSNGSASSSESGMAFGDINGSNLSRKSSTKSSGKRKVSKKSSDEKLNATLLGIGATAAALTAAQKFSKSPKQGRRPELGARREARVSQYGPDGRKQGPIHPSDEGEWVDELPSEVSSDESGLAFDDGNVRRRLSSRPSMDSVGSSSSSNDGLSAWGWRWGSKKPKKQRPITPPNQRQQSISNIPIAGPAAAGMAAGAVYDVHRRRVPSDVGLVDNTPAPTAPMQYIEPQPLSDVSSRHPSMPGAFEDPPLQQPQPIAPFQPAFTQGSPEDPLRPTAGPSSKPPMRRSASSPVRNSKGSFMGDAAFIGGAAVATAGIIASQNRRASPGSVRFGFNGEQQEKFDRQVREEREKEDAERRRADRTRALKEEAERFAREEDEKRVLAERKRRQQEEEDREHQRQLEANQREEAYRREQARSADEARRRAEEERQAEEEERQRFNDRQIREELERKQREREEKSSKKKGRSTDERVQDSPSSWKGPVAAGMAGALAGAVIDGALHKQGREQAQEEPRSRNASSYSTQTFEPTNEHSGAPITDDDLVDPNFFKRRRSPADLRRYEELSNEKLDELTHEREDYYNKPAQSQKDFFMPKELLEREAEGKERSADPYGDNEVDVYQTTGGEARQIHGSDFGRYGKAPVVYQNVPKLNVIAPTPPHSTAGSTKGDKSAPPSPLADVPDPDTRSTRNNDAITAGIAAEAEETSRHMPGGFEDSVYRDQQYPDAVDVQEPVWEPPLSKKDKKKRDKAGKRESAIESEPATPLEEVVQDVSAPQSVSFDAPQDEFAAPVSKKDKKKKGKKSSSAFDDEPTPPVTVEDEPEPEPIMSAEPLVAEEEFAPLSKKDKKKKGKKSATFEDFSEPTTPAQDTHSADAYFIPDVAQDRSVDPVAEDVKEADDFQPLSKKDKKKKGKKSATFEDSEPTTPAQESPREDAYFDPAPAQDRFFDPVAEDVKEADDFQPLSKKDKKKKGKKGLSFEDSEASTPVNEVAMPENEPEPATQIVEPEADNAWESPLSKKDKKKREKEAKAGAFMDEPEAATPVEAPVEAWSEAREPEAEAAWEPPLSKKDKKKREKEVRNAFALETSEPSTPVNEPAQQEPDPLVQEAGDAFEPPLSAKEKKKRKKERQSLGLDDSPSGTPANEPNDPLLEQSRKLDADPIVSSQEATAEPEWEPPLSKKDKKKREKEAQKQGTSFDDPEPESKTVVDDFGGVELQREPEPEADAAWEPPLSKKDKKKKEKESKRQSVSFEDPEINAPVDEFAEPEQSRDIDADAAWEPPLSKKEQKKRDKEAKSQGFGDVAAALMTTAGVAAVADAVSKSDDEDYSTGKKSKKNKKKSSSYDDHPASNGPSDMPGTWDESSSDAAKEFSVVDKDIPREDAASPSQESPVDDYFGSGDTKKSKKKKKRESGRFNEPATGSPLRSEVAFDDYLGDAMSANGDAQSTGYGRGGRGPSYYDDDYPTTGSPRAMSPDGAQSTVSAPGLERRKSSKSSKSKRRSEVYDEPADFDDTRSIRSAATEPARSSSTSSKKDKEKKGGLFGLFSRSKSSDGDKRDQSFLGDRVEDLPLLPSSDRQTSALSASALEEQDHGTPATAEAVDQAVTGDPVDQGASASRSYYTTEPVAGSGNTDIWGDPMGDVSAQPDPTEDVWGDEEFADRPSLPREAAVDQALDPMAAPAEGAPPARTGGPMTNVQEDFDDWFGSTDPTPKAPLLIKGKKGKKAKKGKAAQAKTSAPSSPAAEIPKEEVAESSIPSTDSFAVPEVKEAEQTRDLFADDVAIKDVLEAPAASTEPATSIEESTPAAGSKDQDNKSGEPAVALPLSDVSATEPMEELSSDQLSVRRPSLTPRPVSSTAVPLRFRAIPSSPSFPRERSASFGSQTESAPISPASVTGSNKKPRPRSSEFREVRPLYLVSRNSKLEDVEEQLPDLPESKPSSRASSVQGSEDWHSAAEDMSPQPDLFKSPGSRGNLTIDLEQANRYRTEEEIMDSADQTTPKASDFSQTALLAPRSHSKQVPQFYTWEDLAKDEQMHDAAARQAGGVVEPEAPASSDASAAEGLGIEQTADETQDAPARKGKKDKRKSKGLAAAALLAGGAAAALANDSAEDPQTLTSSDDPKAADTATLDVPNASDAPKELTSEASAAVPDEAADDFFAPSASKKKKAKKGKKAQATLDDLEEIPKEEPAPVSDIPTEGAAAEYFAVNEDAMAKENESAAAKDNEPAAVAPEVSESIAPAEAESAPVEDEWAAMSTSKKGKKAKKGKKQKGDAVAEPEPEPTPTAETEAATPEPSDAPDDKTTAPSAEADVVNAAEPQVDEPAVEPAPQKEAAATSSRGWFSWPFGAKKAAEQGLEVDPVTMQAREVPDAAKEPGLEAIDNKELLEDLAAKAAPERLPQDAIATNDLPTDSKALLDAADASAPDIMEMPQSELVPGETEAESATKEIIPPVEEQTVIPASDDVQPAEVADELWGAPSSTKKKGKKGKKSGQSTPLVTETPESVEVETVKVQDKDVPISQEPEIQAPDVTQADEAQPKEEDGFLAPQPSKKKGKKGKKSDPVIEQTPDDTIVETTTVASEIVPDQSSAPETLPDSSPSEAIEPPTTDKLEETDSFFAPQSSKKKGKKNKKGSAAASAPWDELVAEDLPVESSPDQAGEVAPAESQPESQDPAFDTLTIQPEAAAHEVVEPTPEPEAEDMWAALPSKKKGKKGKKAAKDAVVEPTQDDVPQVSEAPSTDNVEKSLDADSNESSPSEFVDASTEQPTDTPSGEQETPNEPIAAEQVDTSRELPADHYPAQVEASEEKPAETSAGEQETPAAEPEDFWAPQPKGKKAKKGKKARQDAEIETTATPEPTETPTAQAGDSKVLEAENAKVGAVPAETVDEPTAEVPKADDEDLWGAPAKGKKAKKGKKNKGNLDIQETPQPETTDASSEPQPNTDDNVSAETLQDTTPAANADTTFEMSTEQEAAPQDDWTSLTTSKKGKKAKKSKKGALVADPITEEASSGDANDESTITAPETTSTESNLEQDVVVAESLPLPSETGNDALPDTIIEQSTDNAALVDELVARGENLGIESTSQQPEATEAVVTEEPVLPTSSEELPKDAVQDTTAPEPSLSEETAPLTVQDAADTTTAFDPLPTKKSKKDKKKSKKSLSLDVDEPIESTQPLAEEQTTAESDAKIEDPSLNPESSTQDESKREIDIAPAQEEPPAPIDEAVPAEPSEDFGSFSTKKSKKDKNKGKKGKATDVEDLPTPSSPLGGAAANDYAGETTDPVPVLDATVAPPAETEGAAAEYFAGHPDSVETAPTAAENADFRDLSTEQPTETPEEFATTSAKSKKDKKKAKKAAASSWDTELQESPLAGEEPPATAVVEDVKPIDTEPTEPEPTEEFGAFSTKSKKDKKKAKKASSSSWDVPEEATTSDVDEKSPPAATEDVQPIDAEPAEELATSSSKKSKKDKKKAKKTATDPWDVVDTDNVTPAEAETQPESESKAADDQAIDVSRDIPSDVVAPLSDAPIATQGEITQDPGAQNDVNPNIEAKEEDDSAFSTKKSKKDKKKAKKSKGVAFKDSPEQTDAPPEVETNVQSAVDKDVTANEPEQDIVTASLEPSPETQFAAVDAKPVDNFAVDSTEPPAAPAENSLVAEDVNVLPQEAAVLDAPQDDTNIKTDDFDAGPTKKSKKDKKKAKKGQSTLSPWDEPEPTTPAEETSRDLSDVIDSTEKTVQAPEEAAVAGDPEMNNTPEAQAEAATLAQTAVAEEDADFIGSSTTKKSKKDKKKAKKGQAALWDEPETATPAAETPLDAAEEPANIVDKAPETPRDVLVLDETPATDEVSAPPETAPDPVPVSEAAPAQEDTDDFASSSTKKSKKDKKKAKKASEASPWDEVPAAAETTIELPSDEQDIVPTTDRSLDAEKAPVLSENAEATTESALTPSETPSEEAGEAFGSVSTKKSKKDTKKGKKAQGNDWQTDEPAPAPPVDQEVPAADAQPEENTAPLDKPEVIADDANSAEPTSQPQEADADDMWAAPAKKSKKDKKKGKKAQLEEEVAPAVDKEALADAPISTEDQDTSGDIQAEVTPATEPTTPNVAETPAEDEDAWGSISTKKGKKDKKKSKKSKAGAEDPVEEPPVVPVVEDYSAGMPDINSTTREDDATVNTQETFPNPMTEARTSKTEDVEPVAEPLDQAIAPQTVPGDSQVDETARAESREAATLDQPKDMIESTDQVTSDSPNQDIDFAATLAAGLADSGFDPNLVVDDPVFHRRASPPSGLAEADPEEVFTTSSKKKKGKGKKSRDATLDEPVAGDASAATDATPDDFDAALSQGLQDSGFDPALLASAGSPSQGTPSAGLKDDEDEFSFTKSNKKKKKGKKALSEVVDAPSPTDPALLEQEELPVDLVQATDDSKISEVDGAQISAPVEGAKSESDELSLEEPPAASVIEPVEAGEDEWAATSKSKKKSKKDKKKQDRSLDIDEPMTPVVEAVHQPTIGNIPDAQKESSLAPDTVPEEAPLPEVTGEEEWGAPSKKKKGKKGKKQQEVDWQDGESMATPHETHAEPLIVESQPEAALPVDLTETPLPDAVPAATDRELLADTEQSTPFADDEWAAPSNKKKGKKGKSQPTFDLEENQSLAPPVLDESLTATETLDVPATSSRGIIDSTEPVPESTTVLGDLIPAAEIPTDEAPPVDVEPAAEADEDEWAALSSKKKKNKKGKKNQISESLDEVPAVHATADPAVPDDSAAVIEEATNTSDNIAQDTPDVLGAQPPTLATAEEPAAAPTVVDEEWAAPSSKKDKKKKKKKGIEWDEPESATQETSRNLVEDSAALPAETLNDSGPQNHEDVNIDKAESAELPETAPVVPEAVDAAEDEWAAPSKNKKGKKSKKNQDEWAESETRIADAEPAMPEALPANDQPISQSEDPISLSRDIDQPAATPNEATVLAGQLDGPVAEAADEEWGLPSKKKGKKNKKKAESIEPQAETTSSDSAAPLTAVGSTPTIGEESPRDASVPDEESTSKAISFDDSPAMGSPAPADADWDLPIKKKGKKGKKTQLWAEDEPQASAAEPLATTEPQHVPDLADEQTATPSEPQLPVERSLDVQAQGPTTPAPVSMAEQPVVAANDEEWGLPTKKKGKKTKKKEGVSDADLDPFIDTPADSSAPISTTDTAEASATDGTGETFQPSGEMDIDEMDKAYKTYKKNKRKQKKLQATSGDENSPLSKPPLEQDSEQQHNTSRDLGASQQTEPARQPSPFATEEPSWSFAKLDEDKTSGDTSRGLTKMPSRGSLTSRRSLEPLHVDTASQDASQNQQEHQGEAPRSAHGRTASKDTPLESTSRQRASYLFQSPAPFQDSAPNNSSNFRTPEQRGDASDYFHSRDIEPSKDPAAEGPLSPSAGLLSPRNALDPIPEEFAAHKRSLGDASTNITPMEPAGKMLRRTETPKAIREQSLNPSTSRDGLGSTSRSASNPVSGLGPADEGRTLKRVVSDTRSPSVMSNRSNLSATQRVVPEELRTLSRASNRSVTPTLRRTKLSGDLRAESRTSDRRGDSGSGSGVGSGVGSAVGARASPKTIPFEPPPTPPLNDEDEVDPGATRAAGMAETFQGYGGGQVSQVSPTRPPSMRKRQSMHVMDLETKLEQLTSENRALQEAQQSRGLDDGSMDADNHGLQQALDARELELREKNNEIQHIQAMLEPMQQEINRLVQINGGLTDANRTLVDDSNGRYAALQNDHANVTQQWQNTTRDLEKMRQEHSRLSNGMRDAVAAQLSTALAEKDHEIRKLKDELAEASDRIRALQVQIQSSKASDFLNVRDEDYFDGACQKLCQHVQQWVLRFSKMSDNRICRLSSDLRDEKIEARLDNALLDGMDVDKLLGDRVRRRDVFMSVVMTMVWEYVFTRYLFGMDREQRQKLKALEKTLSEVGPPRAVATWRATTLTLLSKRPAFSKQCALDTEAVAHEIFGVLSALLTPPTGSEQQLLSSLTKVITVAVNLSVEMRTQRSEYIMLPPLQPEYDTNGDLVRKVHFNASLMNERSGLFTSNEALESERAIVKIVLFPLVVKKGDEYGEGEEEIVVCPAQVLVHNDSGKSRKVVRVMSGAMEIDDPRRSKQSLISKQGSMQF